LEAIMGDKLQDLFNGVRKQHGKLSVRKASELEGGIPRIPTGIFWLDADMGGGIPIGRMTEVVGLKSSGKSSLMAKIVASAQRLCRKCFRPITEWEEEERERKSVSVDVATGEVIEKMVPYMVKVAKDCANKCREDSDGKKKKHPGRMTVLWVDQEGCVSEDNEILDPMTGRIATVGEWVRGQGCNVESLAGNRLSVVPISSKCDSGIRPVLRIFTATGWVEVTPNHPLLVWRRGQTWIPAAEIQPGDYIARPRWSSFEGGRHPDAEVAGLLGYMLGDGGIAESASSPTITNKGDPEIMRRFSELVSYFGCKIKKYDDRHYRIIGEDSNGSSGANKGRNGVKNWFRERGMLVPCYEKFLPEEVFQWDNISVGRLLVGLFMTDGSVNIARASAVIGFTSRRLILQVRHLLSRLGILAHLSIYRYKNPRHRDQHTLAINGVPNLQRFREFVPLYGEKGSKLDSWCLSERKQIHYPDDFYLPGYRNAMWSHRGAFENESDVWWDKVVKIEPRGEKHCWDFGVPPHKNFVVNDFVGHNTFTPDFYRNFGVDCDDVYLSSPETGEQAVDLIDAAMRTEEVDLIVVDSVAAMTPSVEREASAEDLQVSLQARNVNKGLRVWTASLNALGNREGNDCTLLLVNQLRTKIASFYTGYVKPGGVGQEFATSAELFLKQKDYILDTKGATVAEEVEYLVDKNKVGTPKGVGRYRMCLKAHPAFPGMPDPLRLPGDTWDDATVLSVLSERGFLAEDQKTKEVILFGQRFPDQQALQMALFQKGDLYWKARNALIQLIVNTPSDGKLKEKKKKGDKEE
jgi:RecA/RadA recombinase